VREISKKEVRLFIDKKNNSNPFEKWLDGLEKSEEGVIEKRIKRVREGNYGDYKSLGGGILELRFHQGYRIYFTEVGNTIVILLCGGDKSNQEKDIAKAKEYKRRLDEES
jgi:putative addiction module killer protein